MPRRPVRWGGALVMPSHLTRAQVARLRRVTLSAVYQMDLPTVDILGTLMIPISVLIKKGLIVLE